METERRILRSTSILFTANMVSQLANFGFVILFARAYSPALFGEYSFALSLGSVLALFVGLGTNGLLLRICSRDPSQWQSHAGLLLPWQLLLAMTTWLVTVGACAIAGVQGTELRIIAFISLFQLFNPLWTLFSLGFTATERMGYSAMADAGGRILILSIGTVLIWIGATADMALLGFPFSAVLILIVLTSLASTAFGRPRVRMDWRAYASLLRQALPFFGIVALTVIYGRIGILLLRAAHSPEEVGVFASAERLVMATSIVHATFAQALYPAMVRLFTDDKPAFHQLVNRCARLLILLTLPLATVLHLFASDVVDFLFGDRYQRASEVLRIAAWLIAIRGVTTIMNNIGLASDRQRLIFFSNLSGVLVLIISAALLTPHQGAVGLAISALLAQSVKSMQVFLSLRPDANLPALLRIGFPVLAACIVTTVAANLVAESRFLARATCVFSVGIGTLYLFQAIHVRDFRYAYSILSTRANHRAEGS